MPLSNLRLAADSCDECFDIVIVSEYVVVMCIDFEENCTHGLAIIPFSTLPCEDPLATSTLLELWTTNESDAVFFLDDKTLCLIQPNHDDPDKSFITWVNGTDPEFSRYTIVKKTLDLRVPSDGKFVTFGIVQKMQVISEPPTFVVTFEADVGRGKELYHIKVTVTAVAVEHKEVVEVDERENERRGFFSHVTSDRNMIYYDTGSTPMRWMRYDGDFRRVMKQRWVVTVTDNMVSIFDALEQRKVPSAIIDIPYTPDNWMYLSMDISKGGRGIVLLNDRIYVFTVKSVIQSLETLSTVAAWNLLPASEREELNSGGPIDFYAILRVCCTYRPKAPVIPSSSPHVRFVRYPLRIPPQSRRFLR